MLEKLAFVLPELIVVLVIVGILVALIIPSYQGYIEKQRAAIAEANLMVIYNAQKRYKLNNNEYFPCGNCGKADNVSIINKGLGIYIRDPNFTYNISGEINNGKTIGYTATATRVSGICSGKTMQINQTSSTVIKNCEKW